MVFNLKWSATAASFAVAVLMVTVPAGALDVGGGIGGGGLGGGGAGIGGGVGAGVGGGVGGIGAGVGLSGLSSGKGSATGSGTLGNRSGGSLRAASKGDEATQYWTIPWFYGGGAGKGCGGLESCLNAANKGNSEDIYGNNFDDAYYTPDYQPAVPASKWPMKKAANVHPSDLPVVQKVQRTLKGPTPEKAKSRAGMSCDTASSIVGAYGFSDVKPANCTGQVYAFDGSRDGRAYTIKLNAASGELTEVRKVR